MFAHIALPWILRFKMSLILERNDLLRKQKRDARWDCFQVDGEFEAVLLIFEFWKVDGTEEMLITTMVGGKLGK